MIAHVLGGATCREYLGRALGYCSRPGTEGLCPEHAQARLAWEARMKARSTEWKADE